MAANGTPTLSARSVAGLSGLDVGGGLSIVSLRLDIEWLDVK
jgi:hypothetical protein